MLLFLLIISSITITNSFSMKTPPPSYICKFMIFNKKSSFVMKQDDNSLSNKCSTSNKKCNCKTPLVKKKEDVFDKFERVSREGNKIMQKEYLKEIQKHLKDIQKKNDI